MKKLLIFLLITSMALSMAACGGKSGSTSNTTPTSSGDNAASSGKVYEFKLGHTGAPNHHYQYMLEKFAEDVKTKTNGQIIISVFPSDQLGNQMESTEGTMLGTHDMVLTSDMVLSNWVPEMGILNLPFLFKDNTHLRKVLDGEIGQKFADLITPTGAFCLAFWDNGFRHITNSKRPINSPEDVKGLKIRVPEGEVYLDTFTALGAIPTVISFGELYSALQLNTVDGQENPPAHIITQKFYEVQKYVARTGHIHSCSPLLINKKKFDALPSDLQKILVDSAKEYAIKHTQYVEELEAEQWKEIEANGMEITDPDKAPFEEAVQPVIEKARKKFGSELIDAILELKE
ncbi:MAG TPA: TRAP transporter substrate-binding protein [Clostridiaceae bacterium]|nr:TRAP transporter substrate-binding protein [Clostridiaceae bacterium]